MKTARGSRHWLDKASPRWWQTKGYWRVRLMRQGTEYQWVLKNGKSDPSSTGRALATAEWFQIKAGIQRDEQDRVAPSLEEDMNLSAVEQAASVNALIARREYESSGLAGQLSFADFLAFKEFLACKQQGSALAIAADPAAFLPSATTQPLSFLISVFRAHLTQRHERTDKTGTLKSSEDLGRDRYNAYCETLRHFESVVGNEPVVQFGDFKISEPAFAKILSKYRESCLKERTERQVRLEAENAKNPAGKQKPTNSGHWFNERMKTARTFSSYLASNRLISAMPPNIESLTARFQIEATARPMPVSVVRALVDGAKDELRAFTLLAVNCGFRQAELATLRRDHLRVVAGRLCVVKNRGKTGVAYAIPLWPETVRAIEKWGRKTGLLFLNKAGKPLINGSSDHVYQRFVTLRNRVKVKTPDAVNYNFENFRDTGSSFIDGLNPSLTSLYLGQADGRMAALYVGNVEGEVKIPG